MILHALRQRAVVLTLPALLAACAAIAPSPAPQPAFAARDFHESIDIEGRISVRYQHDNKDEALHGSFTWNQNADKTAVTLLSPLGQTIALITTEPAGATLAQGGQPVRYASDVDALTAEALGWTLPVAGLRDWLQGFGTDHAGRRFTATPQAADVTTRDGWQIRYASWHDDGGASSPYRPKRIDLFRQTAQAGELSIRIVIDTWQAH